jgi:hypothetical protein
LAEVTRTHYRLVTRGEIRPVDHVTKPVVELLISFMLQDDPGSRQNALWLWTRSRNILQDAQAEPEDSAKLAHSTSDPAFTVDSQQQSTRPTSIHTPPGTSNGRWNPSNGNPHGPPPTRSGLSPHAQLPERRHSIKQITRRAETFQGRTSSPEIASRPVHVQSNPNLLTLPPPSMSPPLNPHLGYAEQAEHQSPSSDEYHSIAEEQNWQANNRNAQSPTPGPTRMNTIGDPASQSQGTHYLVQNQGQFDSDRFQPGHHITTPILSYNTSPPMSGVYNPPPESDLPQATTGNMSITKNRPLPVTDSLVEPQAQPKDVPATNQKPKPKKPELSFEIAQQYRYKKRTRLPNEGLLNDLKDRDHVGEIHS